MALALEIGGEDTDSLSIALPSALQRGSAGLVAIAFTSQIFQSGSTFQVEVGHSDQPDNWQEVDPGQGVGDELGPGEGLTVLTPLGGRTVKVVNDPGVFTPNGDGINDEATIQYNLLSLSTPRPVEIALYDLSGRRVRVLFNGVEANGRYLDKVWDGRDDRGQQVPPGLYIARVFVAGDSGEAQQSQIIGVAY